MRRGREAVPCACRAGSAADTGQGMCGGSNETAVLQEMLNCCFWQLSGLLVA